MNNTLLGAIIGAAATILAVLLAWLLPARRKWSHVSTPSSAQPDKDSIYFMQFLLHDAYEQDTSMTSLQLAEHQLRYSPLEVEAKLVALQELGLVQRTNRIGPSKWQMTARGVKFMFDNGHQLQDLVVEQRGAQHLNPADANPLRGSVPLISDVRAPGDSDGETRI